MEASSDSFNASVWEGGFLPVCHPLKAAPMRERSRIAWVLVTRALALLLGHAVVIGFPPPKLNGGSFALRTSHKQVRMRVTLKQACSSPGQPAALRSAGREPARGFGPGRAGGGGGGCGVQHVHRRDAHLAPEDEKGGLQAARRPIRQHVSPWLALDGHDGNGCKAPAMDPTQQA